MLMESSRPLPPWCLFFLLHLSQPSKRTWCKRNNSQLLSNYLVLVSTGLMIFKAIFASRKKYFFCHATVVYFCTFLILYTTKNIQHATFNLCLQQIFHLKIKVNENFLFIFAIQSVKIKVVAHGISNIKVAIVIHGLFICVFAYSRPKKIHQNTVFTVLSSLIRVFFIELCSKINQRWSV